MSGEPRKFELTGPQIAGSALAAVTAAVAASYLGVAGTVIGAALMSAGTTVGTAVYSHYLKRTGDKVRRHTALARRGTGRPRRWLPWGRVAVAATLVFGISMAGILTYQIVADRTVADQIAGKPRKKPERARPTARRGGKERTAPAVQPLRTWATATPSGSASPHPTLTWTPPPATASRIPTPTPTGEVTAPAPPPAPPSTVSGSASPATTLNPIEEPSEPVEIEVYP
ncbi:MAG TPA: hypothetical protein VFV66_06380 [Nonomuraea sp.]|nr:hypothetical protein [Nonomuraea sp.]